MAATKARGAVDVRRRRRAVAACGYDDRWRFFVRLHVSRFDLTIARHEHFGCEPPAHVISSSAY